MMKMSDGEDDEGSAVDSAEYSAAVSDDVPSRIDSVRARNRFDSGKNVAAVEEREWPRDLRLFSSSNRKSNSE